MVRSVDQVLISDWTAVGTSTLVPKYTVDISVLWTKDDGTKGTWSGTRTFPNALAGIPLKALKRIMEGIIMQAVRVELGIEEWPEG